MKWTEERVATAIARTLFDWRRNVVVPNLSWGLGLGWEVDLGVLSDSGWLTEVEIKVTLADFKKDSEKYRHRIEASPGHESKIRRKFFALPHTINQKRFGYEVRSDYPLPEGCGLIVVSGGPNGDKAEIVEEAKVNPNARKLRDDERRDMLRLGYIRFWAQRDATTLAQAGLTRAFEEHITKEVEKWPAEEAA
jgi:hypothetical protein